MANATTLWFPPSALDGLTSSLSNSLSNFHMAWVNLFLPSLGEYLTYTLQQFLVLRAIGVAICWLFEHAENKGWWQNYRIQPHRNLSKEYVAEEWDQFIGKKALVGFFVVVLPMYYVSWVIHKWMLGSDTVGIAVDPRDTELGWGLGLWWRIAAAIYIDDTVLFVMHVIIHKVRMES